MKFDCKHPKVFNYLVLYESKNPNNKSAIKISDYVSMRIENSGSMLQIDKDIFDAIPLFEYCLHLPRNEFDVCDVKALVLDKLYDAPQSILFCP